MMKSSNRKKRLLSFLLSLVMIMTMVPITPLTAFAVGTDNLCDHHTEHTAECGYVEAQDEVLCSYECNENHDETEEEPTEETIEEPTEEPDEEAPVCYCAEACTAELFNESCEACGVDYTKCVGQDTASAYADSGSPYAVVDTEAGTLTIDGTFGGKAEVTDDNEISALVKTIQDYVESGGSAVIVTGSELAIYYNGFYDNYPAYAEALYYVTEEQNSKYCGSIDLILPDVTEIGEHEFHVAFSLKSVTLPKVTTIGDAAFWECMYLQTLTFGSVVTSIGSKVALAVEVEGGTDLVLNCGQMQTEGNYKPNLETNEWGYNSSWEEVYNWKSITLTHTPVADDGDCTTPILCSVCGETVVEAKESHISEKDENKATCQNNAVCDLCGTEYGEVDSENHEKETYTNGFRDCCDAYEPAMLNDENYYEISNAGQLFWFAESINNGTIDKYSNAVLTADIDLGGMAWTPICSTDLYYKTTTYSDRGYEGIFDGANHVISNLSITGTAEDGSFGLIGTLSGTVKNLGIDTFAFVGGGGDTRVGAVVGQMLDYSLVENCFAIYGNINTKVNTTGGVAGGIAGCNYAALIKDCFVMDFTISAGRDGGIVGDNRADGDATDRPGEVLNGYTDYGTLHHSQNEGMTATGNANLTTEQFASGEVAYLLGEGWGQTIGTDDYPILGGEPVLTDGSSYFNDIVEVTITWTALEFTYTNGEWQPESHSYADGAWTPDAPDGNVITLVNNGTVAVNVTFTYTKTVTEVQGSFTDENGNAITSLVALAVDEEKRYKLILNGKPNSTFEDETLGSVTVTITLPEE